MISAGAAVFPYDGDTYEALLATADGRMYRDKNHRRTARAGLRTAEAGETARYTGDGEGPHAAARAR
jgi:GGDEF domain-containing protein